MMIKPTIEQLWYVLVIVLCLGALALVLASPEEFLMSKVVYQGF